MNLRTLFTDWFSDAREFVAPRYRPEFHYMRGTGPAFARRAVMVESRQVLPILREPHRYC